jgi:sugar O-acyltransferase (sialic acid O-acetyltransferase NeuD family)
VILGASAFPEIAELIRDINHGASRYAVRCLLDDDPARLGSAVEGVPVTGPLDLWVDHPDALFVMGIGSFRTRMARHAILTRLAIPDDRWASLVHPAAKIYSTASVGAGAIVHHGAVVANGARLGRWVIVLWNTVVGADAQVGDGAMLTSNVTTNSGVRIGPYAFVGAGSAVAERVEVGPGAMVAMGSRVLRDVPAGVFQFGEPPRVLGREPVPDDVIRSWTAWSRRSDD